MASESGDVRQFPRHESIEELQAQADELAQLYGERVEFDAHSYANEYERLVKQNDYTAAAQLVVSIDEIVQSWHDHLHFAAYTYDSESPETPRLIIYAGKIADYIAGKPDTTKNWDEYLNTDSDVDEMVKRAPQLALVVRATERSADGSTIRYWRENTRPVVNIPLDYLLAIYKDKPLIPPQATE